MQTGAFGGKIFCVNEKDIVTPSDIQISESLNFEMIEREGLKPSTYIKGLEAMEISFTMQLSNKFCNILDEVNFWFLKMRNQEAEYLTIGNKSWGTNKFIITDVSATEFVVAKNVYQRAEVAIKFTEYVAAGTLEDT